MTKTQANEPSFVLANEAKPDPRIAPLAKAMEAKRAELIGQPLSFIWNDLARVALAAAPIVPAPAYEVKELEEVGTADEWKAKREELQTWTGSAWLAGEADEDLRPTLYSFLCSLIGWMHAGEDAASLVDSLRAEAAVAWDKCEVRRVEALKLREAVEYANAQGFIWPVDPLPPTVSTHTAAGAAPVEEADAKAGEGLFLIRKRGAYYRPNEQGYTSSTVEAGRYSRADAERITHPNGSDGPRDGMDYVPAPPASTIPSEPEPKGEAGAGPVGEAVAWQWRTRIKGGAWDAWENGKYLSEPPPHMEVERRPLYARPVEEPGEVERLTRERDAGFNHGYLMAVANIINLHRETVVAADVLLQIDLTIEDAEAFELAEYDMEALERLRSEPRAADFFKRRAALSTQESSAALAGDGKEVAR